MNKKYISLLFVLFVFEIMKAQLPVIQWQKSYGGSEDDIGYSVTNVNEGGYILVGSTESQDGDVIGYHNPASGFTSTDTWLIRLDSAGLIIWSKCLGGTYDDDGKSVSQTFDGGFIIAGSSYSRNGDVSGLHGFFDDCWIVKSGILGNIQWQKCLGGDEVDYGNYIIQTRDSGYLACGRTSSINGDVSGNHGAFDVLVIKLSKDSVRQWSKAFGGTGWEGAITCKQISDGGYIIGGSTDSNNGNVSGQHNSMSDDIWVIKLDSNGVLIWQKCYGGTSGDGIGQIIQSSDGGYYILGWTVSNDGDVSNLIGSGDMWLIKIDSIGNIQWNKCFGGIFDEGLQSGCSTSDGGILMLGYAYTDNGLVSGTHGNLDYWIVKVDTSGNFEWAKAFGGTEADFANSLCETPDGGYIIAGYTTSIDGDVTFNHGKKDVWVVKLAPQGLSVPEMKNTLMDLTIFQNNDQLSLRYFSKQNENGKVIIYDNTGKQIFEKNISVNEGINYSQINCEGFAKGMFVVKIEGERNSMRKKIFIE